PEAAGTTAPGEAVPPTVVVPAEGGPTQPVPGPRRDPILPPLLERDATREWVLAVELNGRVVSQGSVFVEAPEEGGLLASVPQLKRWRVRLDEARVLTLQGEPFYPLAAIPGATFTVDRANLSVALVIPSDQLAPYRFDPRAEAAAAAASGWGGFADYDVLFTDGTGLRSRLDGLLELGAFGTPGVITTSLRLEDLTAGTEVVRLDTTVTKDLPARRETLRLGDSLTTGGAFARPVRFAGVQWGTNFATDPSFVTFPLPTIGGLAEQDSVVDVFVNNLRQATGELPAGPFTIDNVPALTGAGEIQLKVTDLLGRERMITQPYYVSSRLLREGLHDFGYELGFERQSYGSSSFDYGDPLLSGTHRYGFSPVLTGEVHAELQPEQQNLAVGGSGRLGVWGVVSGGVGASLSDGEEVGALGQLAYEYNAPRFNFGLRTRYTSEEFGQLGLEPGELERVDQGSLGLDFGRFGRAGLFLVNQERREDDSVRSLSASHSFVLGPGFMLLRAAQLIEPRTDLALSATYSLPLGGNRLVAADLDRSRSGSRGRVQYRQTRGASDLGLDYRLAGEVGDDARRVDARFNYQHEKVALGLDLENGDGDTNLRAGVSGSVAMVDGKAKASRRLGRAFGMVALPGYPGVRVYLDNREVGRTDADGFLVLPALRAYQANRVRIEIEDLPLEAQIAADEVAAVPFERAGVTIGFVVNGERQATAVLLAADGAPLPGGLRLASADGAATAWVATRGFTQVTGIGDSPVEVSGGDGSGRSWTCTLPAADESAGLLPELGEIRCR
ncbi:MAG TPA: fimbria/pilus outer membrane usher protein, partial [Geminicoccaceae bacterium]|nr:fimbria/pilus outer membrane usher protein [Geminicoccaceae bacterium]